MQRDDNLCAWRCIHGVSMEFVCTGLYYNAAAFSKMSYSFKGDTSGL